jgi:type II secretory pathway pseudopilin PulG
MKKQSSLTLGYSLIEVLVAVAILMFSVVGPMTIATKSMQSARYTKQQTTAFFLAQEGISLTESLRNAGALKAYNDNTDPWAWHTVAPFTTMCKSALGCNYSKDSLGGTGHVVSCTSGLPDSCTLYYNASNLSGAVQPYHTRSNGDPRSIYKRTITWSLINANELIVTSKVEWNSDLFGGKQTVTLVTSLFNRYKDL